MIFGIFSMLRSAADAHHLDSHVLLSVMQQHIVSTVCLHQHQLQTAWRYIHEAERAQQTAKSSAGVMPE